MALQNDDWDIRKAWLFTEAGSNGDYYITIATKVPDPRPLRGEKGPDIIRSNTMRVTTSGSRYPSEVMLAVAHLHRTLEKYGLNSRDLNEELEFKMHVKPSADKVDYAFYGTEVASVEKYADRIEIKYSDGKKFVFTFKIEKQ